MPIVILIVLVGATFLNLELSERYGFEEGFITRYSAAKNWMKTGVSPYSEESHALALELAGDENALAGNLDQGGLFFGPGPLRAFFISRLVFLPYSIAKAIWMTIIEVAIVLSAWLAMKIVALKLSIPETILISIGLLFFYPNLKMILSASVLPLYFFFIIWAIWLAMNKQGRMAGVLFFLAFAMVPISLFIAIFFMIWLGARRDNSLTTIFL